MRVRWMSLTAVMLLTFALAGCGQHSQTVSEETSTDSLLAANPSEQTAGDITPRPTIRSLRRRRRCRSSKPKPTTKPKPKPAPERTPEPEPVGVTVPAGTAIKITFDQKVTSETARRRRHLDRDRDGSRSWSAPMRRFPPAAKVHGVISGAAPAQKGSRAFLVLAVRSVEFDGQTHSVHASTDSIIAGSPRARNLGAIAGGAAAGALLGKAIGGGGKGALIGGLIGGAAATGAVSASKGYQVEMKEGAELTFTTNETVAIR